MKYLFIILLFIFLYFYLNNIYYNKNMKLVFFGDSMFGRNGNKFIEDPFINVKHVLNNSDYVFFNLETTISNPLLSNDYKTDKVFNYQSNGDQLLSLKKYTKDKPVFVSIVNNHSLDYGVKGQKNTKNFLKDNNFLYNSKQKVEYDNIIFLNATDHCGCQNEKLWSDNIWMIDYNDLEKVYRRIDGLDKKKLIVFSIHWGSNWVKGDMPEHIKAFGRNLIDHGVNIVFGHSAHHIVANPIEKYNNGIIIYGLGDFINDYSINKSYKSDEALICIIKKKRNKLEPELIKVKRKFVDKTSSIPFLS